MRPVRPRTSGGLFVLAASFTCAILFVGWYAYKHNRPSAHINFGAHDIFDSPGGLNMLQFAWIVPGNPQAMRSAYTDMWAAAALAILLTEIIVRKWNRTLPIAIQVIAWLGALYGGYSFLNLWMPSSYDKTMGILAGVLLVLLMLLKPTKLSNRLYSLATILFLILIMLPGAWKRFDLSTTSWQDISIIENHYIYVVSVASRLSHGLALFRDVAPNYGLILPFILSICDRVLGPFSMGDYYSIIKLLQAIYLFIAAYCFYRVAGRNKAVFLILTVFACGYYYYNSYAFTYPNHSALRHIGTPLSMLLLICLAQRSLVWRAVAIGIAVTTVMMLNLEVGIADAAMLLAYFGFFFFFSLQAKKITAAAKFGYLFLLAAGGLIPFIVFLPAYRAVQGRWVDLSLAPGFLNHIRLVMRSNFGAESNATFQPLAIIIFGHAFLTLIYTWANRGAWGNHRAALRFGIACFLIVWIVYYANRPEPENLICYYLPYGVLLADTLRTLAMLRRPNRIRVPYLAIATAALALICVVGPQLQMVLPTYWQNYWNSGRVFTREVPNSAELSGVLVPVGERAISIQTKAAAVRSWSQDHRIIYLTSDCYFIPLISGSWSALPFADAYTESLTRPDFDRLISSIVDSKQDTIFIDTPESLQNDDSKNIVIPGALPFYDYLRFNLSKYFHPVSQDQGWQVWKRS